MLSINNTVEANNFTHEENSEDYGEKSLYDNLRKSPQDISYQESVPLHKTSISALDRNLGGGLPAGSTIYFSADPRSMSEIFLYQFTQSRKTYYFTTERRPKFVLADIINAGFDPSNIIFVDIYSEYYFSSQGDMVENLGNEYVDSKILEFAEYNLGNIQSDSMNEEINIIIDSFSFFMNLRINPGAIRQFTNLLYESTKSLQCLTYLYCLKGSHPENLENSILVNADVIFESSLERASDKVINTLSIPKIRGMVPNSEIIKFKIGEGVQIDTSRDIA
ncbi:RAD55 family ATPase [Methanolobus sp. ZRKC3]|uniref:RAD55 family ATPase n=1 Tax=Methanolobus sp. ZRKC3 TaxID=3125786 RepID=UPI003247EF11